MSTFVSSEKVAFKNIEPGIGLAVAWGDRDAGPYGAFVKMPPGFDAGMHTHTHDVWIVGVRGGYLYKDELGEKRVGPGDFILVKGGHKHWSGADQKEGTVFYEESNHKFDLIPTK